MIIKELQAQFNKGIKLLFITVLLSCTNTTDSIINPVIKSSKNLEEVNNQLLLLKPNLGLVFYNGKPFTGISIKTIHEIKIEEIHYLAGIKHGSFKKWFSDGSISYKTKYVAGKKEGKAISWWRNGTIRSEEFFKNGLARGVQKQWYKTGEKFKEITISEGKEEGLQKAWRKNGKLFINYEAKNGRIFGLKRASLCYDLQNEKVQYKK